MQKGFLEEKRAGSDRDTVSADCVAGKSDGNSDRSGECSAGTAGGTESRPDI